MNTESAFQLLGIPQGATRREIDIAYRRAALRCHPDKPGGSAQAFQKVRAAYTVAINEEPVCGCHSTTPDHSASYVVQWMFHAAAAVAATACRASEVQLSLRVSLEDEYMGRVKKLVITVMRWDNATLGLVRSQQTLFVPLSERRDEYLFPGMGDDPPIVWLMVMRQALPGCAAKGRGDVRLRIERIPHHAFRVDDVICVHDLHVDVSVTPFDHYYGKQVDIDHFDGLPPVSVHYSRTSGAVHIEKGRGMPLASSPSSDHGGVTNRGDLHVFFDLHLPDIPPERLAAPGTREAMQRMFAPPQPDSDTE